MTLRLAIAAGPDQGQVFELLPDTPRLIGRGQEADVRLTDPRASRRHCRICAEADRATISDCGSAAGTFVNGTRVAEQQLRIGDVVRIGETELVLQTAALHDESTVAPASPRKITAPADLTELIGRTFHKYQLEEQIARGSTGMVFRARHAEDDRDVALKVLWPELSRNQEDMQRFVRAMKTMFPVRHPNIVRIENAGVSRHYTWVAMVASTSMRG